MATDNGAHVVSLPTMVGFVRLLIMKNARSYVTKHGGLCMATDNGTHVVSLPTMVKLV